MSTVSTLGRPAWSARLTNSANASARATRCHLISISEEMRSLAARMNASRCPSGTRATATAAAAMPPLRVKTRARETRRASQRLWKGRHDELATTVRIGDAVLEEVVVLGEEEEQMLLYRATAHAHVLVGARLAALAVDDGTRAAFLMD